jgi:hypothetical protein
MDIVSGLASTGAAGTAMNANWLGSLNQGFLGWLGYGPEQIAAMGRGSALNPLTGGFQSGGSGLLGGGGGGGAPGQPQGLGMRDLMQAGQQMQQQAQPPQQAPQIPQMLAPQMPQQAAGIPRFSTAEYRPQLLAPRQAQPMGLMR